ncbi:DMT family transporter [Spongiimicrobium sp. 3-5]|uniref:DMT family transporter n=1 Tax=Spongiimicrobium sp. 3-5 TaxID=3332596 RepID=UPI00397FFA05
MDKKWLYFILLSVVWGSSFILIKKALLGLTPVQLGGVRIVFASSFLFIIGYKSLKEIKKQDWKWILAAGFFSSFFPPFLFALAQTEIDSGVTSIFNSLAPLLTTLVGGIMFGLLITRRQVFGVFVGLLGTVALILAGARFSPDQNYWYAIFIILSALGYAFNINIIKKHLSHLSPLAVTTASFGVVIVPALIMVGFSGFFNEVWYSPDMQTALIYLVLLALFGTALANIYFNKLIYVSSPVFAASVTYTIPLVAVLWGVWDGEKMNVYQLIGGAIILLGVYLVNRRRR